ncbi:peptidase S24/S26A/S26B/S26C, partial [Ochromonadaceae sp. CCMP2298]
VCKRVRAVAGDVVKYHYKGVKRIHNIPEHHVWLQGDNSENSYDSREYGPVPVNLIRGRVFWKNGLLPNFHSVH